ncbi:hypothetical protein MSIMFI_00618 [Mycobacterium simulans]|nr:hypothetical protein MSIMFI_00618 [Mycobacterium simulans]
MMSQHCDAVWRWIDWPGRQGKPDTGIDLVARERDTGNYTAVQCKFYEPTHMLSKADIDSFFTASGKTGFTNRVIISTTDRWGKNAEDALADQLIPVQRIGMAETWLRRHGTRHDRTNNRRSTRCSAVIVSATSAAS